MTDLTLVQRRALVTQLSAQKVDRLTSVQLDSAAALLLFEKIRFAEPGEGMPAESLLVYMDGCWQPFSPMKNASDLLFLQTNCSMTTGSHGGPHEDDEPGRSAPRSYSCNALLSGTSVEGIDFRKVVCQAATLLLLSTVQWAKAWAPRRI